MKNSYCLESFENFSRRDGYSIFLRGWYLTKDHDKLNIQVLSDDKPVDCRISVISRPDVVNQLNDNESTVYCGFLIKADLEKSAKDFELIINGDPILQLDEKEFRKSALENDFLYDFVLRQENATVFRLAGFAMSADGEIPDIKVVDSHGNLLDQSSERLKEYSNPFYFMDRAEEAGFDLVFARPIELKQVFLQIESGNKKLRLPLEMNFSRPDIFRYNVSLMTPSRLYPLWKANGSRFLARRLFRQGLYSVVNAQADATWYGQNTPTKEELARQKKAVFDYNPKISLVSAAYNTDLKLLRILIESLDEQSYDNWELCLADGSTNNKVRDYISKTYSDHPKIKYKKLEQNLGIAGNTNEAIALADGDFIGFIDHDDTLRRDALFETVKALNEQEYDFIYSDEDKIIDEKGELGHLFFKPDFSPDYLLSCNYINHFSVVRKSVLDKIGLLRSEFDGSQDYDFLLRMIEAVPAERIGHIAKPLYHWRMTGDSTAQDPESKRWAFDAGKRAIQDYLDRNHKNAVVSDGPVLGTYRVDYHLEEYPMVSILIPNKDHTEELEVLLRSIQKKVTYPNFEVIVVENNSTEKETFKYYEKMKKKYPWVRLLVWDKEFNYSAINNYAASEANGDVFLLMNNDMEIIDGDLIEAMTANAMRKEVGAVGIKLLYKNGRIQHDGVLWGIEGGYHLFLDEKPDGPSYGNLKTVQHNTAAVTGAALMVSRDKYFEVGGLDERYRVAYNDVDFCLKLIKAGYYNVMLPQYRMFHYESLSRGLDNTPEKARRFYSELDRLTDTWRPYFTHGDPFYNVNLSLTRGFYTPRTLEEQSDYQILFDARSKRDKERERLKLNER